MCVLAANLRFVPVLGLCDVLGGDGLVLHADVPEGGGQVGFGHVHLDLDLSVLHLALQLADLLRVDKGMKTMTGRLERSEGLIWGGLKGKEQSCHNTDS